MKCKILIVEDHVSTGQSLIELLAELDYRSVHVKTAEEAFALVEEGDVDIILADLNLPGHDGLWLLDRIQESGLRIPLVMITGNATIDTAVSAIKKGAQDYIEKPVGIQRLEAVLSTAARMRELAVENELLSQGQAGKDPISAMIGRSKAMKSLVEMIRRVAPSDASVLLLGESGTGKELVANAIVALSGRAKGPYIRLNSAALPKDTLESELFGHVKGAFTGAIRDRKGRFELAHKGTLFLDEIGDMPLSTQVKLLRVLQEGEFERVGGSESIKVDVRIVTATNRNIRERVEKGLFREDLFFRLNVIQIEVPPLRDRVEDIPLLAVHFLASVGGPAKSLSPEAMEALRLYRWPGNIRELRNIMERLSIIAPRDLIERGDLPLEIAQAVLPRGDARPEAGTQARPQARGGTLEDLERNAIISSLRENGGVKSEAAKRLGIGLKTLYRKLEKYQEEGVDLGFLKGEP